MDDKPVITQAELQQSIQRFTGAFMDRLGQAMDDLEAGSSHEVSDAALRQSVLYASSALDIATGPLPEVNLLDMLVFVRLSRNVFETHWIPKVYGERGTCVVDALRGLEDDLWRIAELVISPKQHRELEALIEQWRRDNPNQVRVEAIRFMDFAQRVGEIEVARTKAAGGIFSSVKSATRAADVALLMAERAMFLAHRMPFLVRLQARLGLRQSISDALTRVGTPAELVAQVHGFEPMLEQLGKTADRANEVTINTRQMLLEAKAMVPKNPAAAVAGVKRRLDDSVRGAFLYLALLGAAWSTLWWGGYYLTKRRLARLA